MLVDGSGNQVVEYTYDTWGSPLTKTGTMATTLGYLNPFRYRGYVFDEETGLYYLRSRYYNPVWGRFLNADTVLGKMSELLSHNMFAYCKNRIIIGKDPTGKYLATDCVGGGLPDYTKVINERLAEAVVEFNKRSVGDGGPSSLGQMFSNRDNYWWFYKQVDHKGPWDIKEDGPWRKLFPKLLIVTKFIYRGEVITREDLGNFTYGYLGTAMGVHSEFLYQMGGTAAFTKEKLLNVDTILNAYDQALSAGAGKYYGDEEKDHKWIAFGIDAY